MVTRRRFSLVLASSIIIVLSSWMLLHFIFSFSDNLAFSSEIVLHELEKFLLDYRNRTNSNDPSWTTKTVPFNTTIKLPEAFLKTKVCHDTKIEIASSAHVISLPNRLDRRKSMERLRAALGLYWTYEDATSSNETIIETIARNVISSRQAQMSMTNEDTFEDSFFWPDNLEVYADSLRFGPSSGKPFPNNPKPSSPSIASTTVTPDSAHISPLTCAIENSILGVPYSPTLPKHMLLTTAKLACWFSHLQVISRIARAESPNYAHESCMKVSLILEDDIDMELDIRERLEATWEILPKDWDILFIGHCWSDETHFPAIPSLSLKNIIAPENRTTLHPSYAPKCTHAYALHPDGARKILKHLNYPPFAYSRALDQALSWLIRTKRIVGYSVVPSLVVQRKKLKSDVDSGDSGVGSSWKEGLSNGVLDGLEKTDPL